MAAGAATRGQVQTAGWQKPIANARKSGMVHTIVAHPPTTTHRQLNDAELAEAGISAGLLRCSVGLEDLEDLRLDFAAGLTAASTAAASQAARPADVQPVGA